MIDQSESEKKAELKLKILNILDSLICDLADYINEFGLNKDSSWQDIVIAEDVAEDLREAMETAGRKEGKDGGR